MNKLVFPLLLVLVGCASTSNEKSASREAYQVFGLSNTMMCAKKNPNQIEYCDCFVQTIKEVTPAEVVQKSVSNLREYQSDMVTVMVDNKEKLKQCDKYKK
jgi:hypothetical protein